MASNKNQEIDWSTDAEYQEAKKKLYQEWAEFRKGMGVIMSKCCAECYNDDRRLLKKKILKDRKQNE